MHITCLLSFENNQHIRNKILTSHLVLMQFTLSKLRYFNVNTQRACLNGNIQRKKLNNTVAYQQLAN